MKHCGYLLFALMIFLSCNSGQDGSKVIADAREIAGSATMFYGGDIITMEGDSAQYAEALVEKDGKILFVGAKDEAMKKAGEGHQMVDLQGKTLMPSFIDGHSHYINSLLVASQCNLYAPPSGPSKDVPSIIAALKKFVVEKNIQKGQEIIGYGYDENVMPGGKLLNRDDLDAAFPDNPVRVDHVSMHGTVLNSLAMKKYGYDASFKTPPGGVVVRKPGTNEPWGLIMETAYIPVMEKTDPLAQDQEVPATKAGQMLYAAAGVTTAHEGLTHAPQYMTMKRASEAGANIIDVVAYPFIMDLDNVLKAAPQSEWGTYHNGLKLAGVKITIDGSPQGKTAYFTTPYLTGGPGGEKKWKGELTVPQDQVNKWVKQVYDMNVPLILHCNGDGAIDAFLTAYEAANVTRPWNVTTIHTQFMRKDQIPKFVKYKIRPSFYTLHTYYFYEAHLKNRGKEQASYISPMRDAMNAGLRPTNHTDFVVAPLDQMMMLWSAVNRISRDNAKAGISQCITPYEGLKTMTVYGAEQCDESDSKGTLTAGKRADMVILDKNPLKVDKMTIRDIKVMETIKDGKTIFKK